MMNVLDWLLTPDARESALTIPSSTTILDRCSLEKCITFTLTDLLFAGGISIVMGYLGTPYYTWHNRPFCAHLLIMDNKVTSRGSATGEDQWTRVVAAQSLFEGPTRWRVLTELQGWYNGHVAIGISSAPAGCKSFPRTVLNISTPNDVLISTNRLFANGYGQVGAEIYSGGHAFHTGFTLPRTAQTMTLVEVDLQKQIMTVTFRGCGWIIREVAIGFPDSREWRPCVTMTGAVSATILPWD